MILKPRLGHIYTHVCTAMYCTYIKRVLNSCCVFAFGVANLHCTEIFIIVLHILTLLISEKSRNTVDKKKTTESPKLEAQKNRVKVAKNAPNL